MKTGSAYAALLRLYPRDYRVAFTGEMLDAFGQAAEDQRGRGRLVFGFFVLKELTGLLAGAALEWIAKFASSKSLRGRCLPDVLKMRPTGVTSESHYTARALLPYDLMEARRRMEARSDLS